MSDNEITIQLSNDGKFALHAGEKENPAMSTDELVNEALTNTWDLGGRVETVEEDDEDELTEAEREKVAELQEGINMFGR